MTDSVPQFEQVDIEGSTVHFNGPTVSTAVFSVPTIAGLPISEVLIMSDPDNNPSNSKIEISFDGGTKWYPVFSGGTITWTPKGKLTQIKIKPSHTGLNYYGLMNLEPS